MLFYGTHVSSTSHGFGKLNAWTAESLSCLQAYANFAELAVSVQMQSMT